MSAHVEYAIRGQSAAEADFDAPVAQVFADTGGPPTRAERSAARRLLSGDAA